LLYSCFHPLVDGLLEFTSGSGFSVLYSAGRRSGDARAYSSSPFLLLLLPFSPPYGEHRNQREKTPN
jgi:hypothetical protein